MPKKTALVIRHVPVEGVAGFRKPIEDAGYVIDRIDVTDPEFGKLDLRQHDLLVMMGGPMAVYETDRYPWIECQLRRLKMRLEADLPTLGVCFGAQMIAAALGGRVYSGGATEVGFHTVALHDAADQSPLRHISNVPVLHWHEDTFELPSNVELLASSHVYDHQAFRRGRNLLALQFHAEMGEDPRFDNWVESWPEAIGQAGRTPEQLRWEHEEYGTQAVRAGQRMIEEWLGSFKGPTTAVLKETELA